MKFYTFIALIIIIVTSCTFKNEGRKKLAITIDDLPTLSHGLLNKQQQKEYFIRITGILKKYDIHALGFVLGKLTTSQNKNLLNTFIEDGNSLGNHSQNHWDLNKVNANSYINDILSCDTLLAGFDQKIKYFRYPLLHRGDEKSKKDSVLSFLSHNNFKIVPVSIDTDEVVYNLEFVTAYCSGDTARAEKIGEDYLSHMKERSRYYEKMAMEVNKKPISHILLIHMNFINSFYLDELLEWYQSDHWEFIDIEQALSDPFYSLKDNYTGKKGLSYIERVKNN